MPRQNRSKRSNRPTSSVLRIIGGEWRSRKLNFPAIDGVRPTPDRVRETVFNWLNPTISGARCLDLFTGSGALGLESLSRGAGHTTFVDQSTVVISSLQENLKLLNAKNFDTFAGNAISWLKNSKSVEPYDIIFLDPPFRQNLLSTCIELIEENTLLKPNGLVYVETEKELEGVTFPQHWQCQKQKEAGQIRFSLYANRA